MMADLEYATIEAFVQYMMDDEREEFNNADLVALSKSLALPTPEIRKKLETYGLRLKIRK